MTDFHGGVPKLPPLGLLDTFCPLRQVELCPELRARQCERVFEFWEEWEKAVGEDCPVPYWAVVWPAAAVLARYLLDHPELVKGKTVADIGCGGGIAAIAASKCGAKAAYALDIDPLALYFAEENARANHTSIAPLLSGPDLFAEKPPADIVLFADFFYDASHAEMLSSIAKWKENAPILVADGGRTFAPGEFREILDTRKIAVNFELEGVPERTVRLLRL